MTAHLYIKPDLVYTGVGNRDAPRPACWLGKRIGKELADIGYIGRSGGAPGMDQAFAAGGKRMELYPPWNNFEGVPLLHAIPKKAYDMAKEIFGEKSWNKPSRTPGNKSMHARNMQEVLGPHVRIEDASDFLVCYTRDGCTGAATKTDHTGGTATAILAAEKYGVPVINTYHDNWWEDLSVYTGHNFEPIYMTFKKNFDLQGFYQGI